MGQVRKRRILDEHVQRVQIVRIEDADRSTDAGDLCVSDRQLERFGPTARTAEADLRIGHPCRVGIAEHGVADGDVVAAVCGIRRLEHLDIGACRIPEIRASDVDVEDPVGRAPVLDFDGIPVVHFAGLARVEHDQVRQTRVDYRSRAAGQQNDAVSRVVALRGEIVGPESTQVERGVRTVQGDERKRS